MDSLAQSLRLATDGNGSEIRDFLLKFCQYSVHVPEKFQTQALKITARYPNRPLNFLAIEDNGITKIPVFSEEALLTNWTTLPLKLRTIKTTSLIELLPEDWWITLNPADECSKDFSPWELQRLLGTQEDIEEVVNEILSEQGIQSLQLRALNNAEVPNLEGKLQEIFQAESLIQEIFTAVEVGENVEAKNIETLLLGFRLKELEPRELAEFREQIRQQISPLLIGSMNCRILVGVGFSDLELGVFSDFKALVTRE